MWPRVTSSSVRLCVGGGGKGRGGGGSWMTTCARHGSRHGSSAGMASSPWHSYHLSRPGRSLCSGKEKVTLRFPLCFSGCLLPASSRAGPPGKEPSLSGLVGGSWGWDRRLGVSAGDCVPDRRGEGIEAIGLQSVFINILLFYCPHVSWANFSPPFYPGMIFLISHLKGKMRCP